MDGAARPRKPFRRTSNPLGRAGSFFQASRSEAYGAVRHDRVRGAFWPHRYRRVGVDGQAQRSGRGMRPALRIQSSWAASWPEQARRVLLDDAAGLTKEMPWPERARS